MRSGIKFCGTNFCGFCSNLQRLVPQNIFKISHPQKLVPKIFSNNFFSKTQHASEVSKALDAGKLLENVKFICGQSGLRALHAPWVVKLYDFLTSEWGQEVIKNGGKASAVCQC